MTKRETERIEKQIADMKAEIEKFEGDMIYRTRLEGAITALKSVLDTKAPTVQEKFSDQKIAVLQYHYDPFAVSVKLSLMSALLESLKGEGSGIHENYQDEISFMQRKVDRLLRSGLRVSIDFFPGSINHKTAEAIFDRFEQMMQSTEAEMRRGIAA